MKKSLKNRKAFSLVELVVVILIIAILAAAVFLGGATVIKQSRESAVKTDLRNFASYVQDAMYSNPKLQYDDDYAASESYKTTAADGTTEVVGGDGTSIASLPVLELINKSLTDDFKLDGTKKDAWKNVYDYAFKQTVATAVGDKSSCCVVISSMGANSVDESTPDLAEAWEKNTFKSAEDFVKKSNINTQDDYGVVICMIDGAVSSAFYGFDK